MQNTGAPHDALSKLPGGSRWSEPVFIVQEKSSLIALDIIESLRAIGPCRTIHVFSANDLEQTLGGERHVTAALLHMRFNEVLDLGLDQAFGALGARIVITAAEADADQIRAAGWGILERPFTERMIRAELARLGVTR